MLYTKATTIMMKITLSKKVIALWMFYPILEIGLNFIIGVTYAMALIFLEVSSIHFLVYKNKYWRTFVFGLIVISSLLFGLWNVKVFAVLMVLVAGLFYYLCVYKSIYKMCLSLGVELSETELVYFPFLIWRKYGLLKEQIALYQQE